MRNRIPLLTIFVLALALQSSFAKGQKMTTQGSQSTAGKTMSSQRNPGNYYSEAPFACSLTAGGKPRWIFSTQASPRCPLRQGFQ